MIHTCFTQCGVCLRLTYRVITQNREVIAYRDEELATDEDHLYEIDHWAKLFKAKTWEDLRMVVEKNKYMSAAAEEMYERNADEIIREQCQAREEYLQHERWVQEQLKEKDRIIAELHAKLGNQ